ncbi:MAG: hypothetical protein U0359_07295 [Byssovorax sp.]
MASQAPAPHLAIPPIDADPTAGAELARVIELGGLIGRSPRRHKALFALVLLLSLLASAAGIAFWPRTFHVETKILAQRNLVMPSLGNPRRAVPSDSDAPTRSARESILGRDNLLAIIQETSLLERWDRERPPLSKLKDQVVEAVTEPLSDEDRTRAMVGLLEKKLVVLADDSTIKIALDWPSAETAFLIVSAAQRNFIEGRKTVEVSVIADTIGILTAEAERQRKAVDQAYGAVMELRREPAEPSAPPGPPAAAPPAIAVRPASPPPAPAPSPREQATIAARLDEKRAAIRAIEDPRQQQLAQLHAELERLRLSYTDEHPSVLQANAKIRALNLDPPELVELRREEQALVDELGGLGSPERDRKAQRTPRVIAAARAISGASVVVDASPREDEPDLAAAKSKLLVATRKYEDLLDRVDSARIELHTAQAAFKYRYTMIAPPEAPRKAERPNLTVLGGGGLFLGVVLAFFATATRDLMAGRFIEPWQVKRRLSIPILAELRRP